MLNIVGKVQLTNLKEVSPKMVVGTIISYEKDGDNFIPTFINAKFVGEAIKTLMDEKILNKDKIEIHSGVLSTRVFKNKKEEEVSQLTATIFKIAPIKEEKKEDKKSQGNRFSR